MRNFIFVAMATLMLASCAKEEIVRKPTTDPDEVPTALTYSSYLDMEVELSNDTCVSLLEFIQTSKIYGEDSQGNLTFGISVNPTCETSISLEKDIIEVEEFTIPARVDNQLNVSEVDVDIRNKQKRQNLSAQDAFSDGQKTTVTSEWMWQFIEGQGSSVDAAHVELVDVSFVSAEMEETEDASLQKVILNYLVSYKRTDDAKTYELNMAPYYYQKVKASEPETPEVNVPGEPYFICDTIMSIKNDAQRCKFIVYQITPNSLEPADTVKVAQKTLTVVQMGKPGDNSLDVFQSGATSNVHETSDPSYKDGSSEVFSWRESCVKHHFRAEWNTNGLQGVGHTDDIMIYSSTVKVADSVKGYEFNFVFDGQLEVVKNEVVNENLSRTGYLGTRVLTIAGYCNGQKFAEHTGKVVLTQHQ
jgi:hypothetical protein